MKKNNKIKTCVGCGEDKSLSEFHKNPNTNDGVISRCKICISFKRKIYYIKHKPRSQSYAKQYRLNNKDKINQRKREYRALLKKRSSPQKFIEDKGQGE